MDELEIDPLYMSQLHDEEVYDFMKDVKIIVEQASQSEASRRMYSLLKKEALRFRTCTRQMCSTTRTKTCGSSTRILN